MHETTVKELAEKLGVSKSRLDRAINATGVKPIRFIGPSRVFTAESAAKIERAVEIIASRPAPGRFTAASR